MPTLKSHSSFGCFSIFNQRFLHSRDAYAGNFASSRCPPWYFQLYSSPVFLTLHNHARPLCRPNCLHSHILFIFRLTSSSVRKILFLTWPSAHYVKRYRRILRGPSCCDSLLCFAVLLQGDLCFHTVSLAVSKSVNPATDFSVNSVLPLPYQPRTTRELLNNKRESQNWNGGRFLFCIISNFFISFVDFFHPVRLHFHITLGGLEHNAPQRAQPALGMSWQWKMSVPSWDRYTIDLSTPCALSCSQYPNKGQPSRGITGLLPGPSFSYTPNPPL